MKGRRRNGGETGTIGKDEGEKKEWGRNREIGREEGKRVKNSDD